MGRRSSAKVERPLVPRWNRSRGFIRAGFRGPSVVLVDRFDCRSRRAARGQVRPGAMSTRKRPRSSRPLLGAGWRKSVGSRVQGGEVLTPVAVLAFEVRRSERGGGPSGQLVEGRRLGSSELLSLTGQWGRRSWRRVTRPLSRGRRARRERGASEVDAYASSAEHNAADRRAPFEGSPDREPARILGCPSSRLREGAVRIGRSSWRAVKRTMTRAVRWGSLHRTWQPRKRGPPRESRDFTQVHVSEAGCRSR